MQSITRGISLHANNESSRASSAIGSASKRSASLYIRSMIAGIHSTTRHRRTVCGRPLPRDRCRLVASATQVTSFSRRVDRVESLMLAGGYPVAIDKAPDWRTSAEKLFVDGFSATAYWPKRGSERDWLTWHRALPIGAS